MNGERKEVSGLFHGVGTVGNKYAIITLLVEELVDANCKLEPNGIVHVLAADVAELLACHVGQILDFGNGVDQGLDAYLSGCVGR